MSYRAFIKMLLENIPSSSGDGANKKHIIRFRNLKPFYECWQQVIRTKEKSPSLRKVRPLRIIHAFSCPLQSSAKLAAFSFIHSIETDRKIRVYSLKNESIPWGVKRINAPQAWMQSQGNQVGVGVLDTGIDYNHPDLRDCIGHGVNFIQYNTPPIDDNGHGTHIAGTIAAASHNGIFGVAPKAIIHPVKAFDRSGSAYVSDIIHGLDWCIQNRIPVINMSFGMKKYSKSLEEAVHRAYLAGSVIVASSGNDRRTARIDYPAQFRQTIAVGATDEHKRIARFSNRGKGIDIYAPGNRIHSTWLRGQYNELSGTSMATSHVSGVIALMLARNPSLTPSLIKRIILSRANPVMKLKKSGRVIKEIDARKSVRAVLT